MTMDQDIHSPKTTDSLEPDQPADSSNNEHYVDDISSNAFQRDQSTATEPTANHPDHHPKKQKFSLKKWFKSLSKNQKIILGIASVLLLALISFTVWWFVLKPKPTPPEPQTVVEPVVEEKPILSNMTGLPVPEEVNKRNVTGVMIENSPDARPQAGLIDADVVYEAVAEGGITRFLALFHDDEPKYVGPIRSARPYYLHWALPFNAGLAHVGGSPEALVLIKRWKVRDLDQFHNPGAYGRVSSRYAPHNMYSGIDRLNAVEKEKKFKPDNFIAFERKESKGEAPSQIKAGQINLTLSGPLYNTEFKFNKKENKYMRSQAGKKHLDDKTGKQIQPDVLIAIITTKGQNGQYTTYRTTGTGSAYIFQDGQIIKGQWKKKNRNSQYVFTTKSGTPLQLNPGKVWITVVGDKSDIKYTP